MAHVAKRVRQLSKLFDTHNSGRSGSPTVAAIDRLVHHATIMEMNGESYRRRAAADRQSAKVDAQARIASSKNVPEASCRCLTHLFPGIFARVGVRFGGFRMISDARSSYIAQRVAGHLRLRVPIGAEHQ